MVSGNEKIILLDHGSGGRATHRLLREIILPAFGQEDYLLDAALLELNASSLAFTTDGFVVDPIFFPGGNIGSLAVHGTVNDLAMAGAEPLYLSCGLILEEGLPVDDLRRVVESMAEAAREIGVRIVCGDTKVVPRGKADRIFIHTTGIGKIVLEPPPHPSRIRPGDEILVSGPVGEHGLAVLAARENIPLRGLSSDSAPVWPLVQALIQALGTEIHALRDPTRGGLATTLNELAQESGTEMEIREKDLPLRPEVRGGCEILGLDPLYLACEGRFVAIVAPGAGTRALEILRKLPGGKQASLIGKVLSYSENPRVILHTSIGGERILPVLTGEPLPRIC
ncbi:hydrogenase expression/formation protein HypE [Thermosulfurimonas sp.]|uniref:hydrogenase expression/formation protein HypE n=1 Tax=Thermosulfurimonas sp. TaxID=2080236 RepID=UPI0025F0F22D|nr:hydrogenase expression/formation protein HypE [Thermosulfurimonas sp.]